MTKKQITWIAEPRMSTYLTFKLLNNIVLKQENLQKNIHKSL